MVSGGVSCVPTSRSGLRAPVATMQKSASSLPPAGLQTPSRALPLHFRTRAFLDLRPGPLGALQQHAVQSKRE
jgi:hypothetical protein